MAQMSYADLLAQMQADEDEQSDTGGMPDARDFYMSQAQNFGGFDPYGFYNQVTGGAGNVKPGYRADDMLALMKYKQGGLDDAMGNLFDYDLAQQKMAQTGEQNMFSNDLAERQFGLQQQEFGAKYGDQDGIANMLITQFGGPETFANMVENMHTPDPQDNNRTPADVLGEALGLTDPDSGMVKWDIPTLNLIQHAHEVAMKQSPAGQQGQIEEALGGQTMRGEPIDPSTYDAQAMPYTDQMLERRMGQLGPRASYRQMLTNQRGENGMWSQDGKTYMTSTSGRPGRQEIEDLDNPVRARARARDLYNHQAFDPKGRGDILGGPGVGVGPKSGPSRYEESKKQFGGDQLNNLPGYALVGEARKKALSAWDAVFGNQ